MYYDFIKLNNAPISVVEAVENIHMIANNQCYDEEEKVMIGSFKNTEKLLIEVLTMSWEDEKILLLFQMAVFRFCKIYIPKMLEDLKKDTDEYEGLYFYTIDLEEWEETFWKKNLEWQYSVGLCGRESLAYRRKSLREKNPVKKNQAEYYKIESTLESAFKDKSTIEEIKKLQMQYEPYAQKAEKFNTAITQNVLVLNDDVSKSVKELKKIVNIMERHLQGKVTAGDVKELEESLPKWRKQQVYLSEIFDKML